MESTEHVQAATRDECKDKYTSLQLGLQSILFSLDTFYNHETRLCAQVLALLPMDYHFFMLYIGGIIACVGDSSPGFKYFRIER